MKTIYRVQTKDGKGPFMPGRSVDYTAKMGEALQWPRMQKDYFWTGCFCVLPLVMIPDKPSGEHPHHLDYLQQVRGFRGGRLDRPGTWTVGTDGKEQFLHWFPKNSFSWMQDNGFEIFEYKVPDDQVEDAGHQVLFNLNNATLIKVYEKATEFKAELEVVE